MDRLLLHKADATAQMRLLVLSEGLLQFHALCNELAEYWGVLHKVRWEIILYGAGTTSTECFRWNKVLMPKASESVSSVSRSL